MLNDGYYSNIPAGEVRKLLRSSQEQRHHNSLFKVGLYLKKKIILTILFLVYIVVLGRWIRISF